MSILSYMFDFLFPTEVVLKFSLNLILIFFFYKGNFSQNFYIQITVINQDFRIDVYESI